MHESGYKKGKGKKVLEHMMEEVHTKTPSTCPRGGCAEKQLKAIAYSKARQAGARLPHKGSTRAWGR